MSEVLFYQLQKAPLETVLPQLLERTLERGWRALVMAGSRERLESLNAGLWTYRDDSFLPHGGPDDGLAEHQPVYLDVTDENRNAADVLFLVDGAESGRMDEFKRCVLLFDGNDSVAVEAAREAWKGVKSAGHDATYWRQSDSGKWEKQA